MSNFFVELNTESHEMGANYYAACDMGNCYTFDDSYNTNWDVDCYTFQECYTFNPSIWDDTPSSCYDSCYDSCDSCDAGCY